MKILFRYITLMLLLVVPNVSHADDPMLETLSKQKMPEIQEPPIDIKTLPNGIKVYYMQDQELPIFRLSTYFEMGNVYETKDQRGLNSFFMAAWRAGGTKTVKPQDLDERLEYLSASISTTTGDDLSTVKMISLMKDMKEVMKLYYDVLFNPGFDEDRIELIRKNSLNSINRRNEEPLNVAIREFAQSLYGEDSPYAWNSTPETIGAIDKKALENHYKNNVAANRTLIAASSPLDFETFLKTIEPYIKDWNTKLDKKPYPPKLKKEWQKTTELIQKAGNQSSLVVGHFGETRFNKDKFKLVLADEILGGSTFGSRLGNRIRTDLGLAYSIRSHFGFDRYLPPFRIFTQTKSESTVRTLTEIRNILKSMVEEKNITEDELSAAKERIINRLVFEYDQPFNVVTMRLTYDYNGYPPNYLRLYQESIEKVTLQDVKDVIDQYFFPDKLKIMIVGDKASITDLNKLEGLTDRPLDLE